MQPDLTAVIVIVAGLVVAALILWFLYRARRTAGLRDRFGKAEYDRTLAAAGGRGRAEVNLRARETRVAALALRPLEPGEARRLTDEWRAAKARFIDDPAASLTHADKVIERIMGARGYPVGDFDTRFETLTVDRGAVARHYRAGHDIVCEQAAGRATTEDLRQAMVHYEELFGVLVEGRTAGAE